MANTAAYFGFQPVGLSTGAAPNFSLTQRRIASGNSTAIYRGDPVMPVVSSANGYIITEEGNLALLLPFDSGSMIFTPGTGEAAGEGGVYCRGRRPGQSGGWNGRERCL